MSQTTPNTPDSTTTKTQRRSPLALAISVLALVMASAGTAVAAGEIITQPDQLANRVVTHTKLGYESVDGFNLRDGRVGTNDLTHPTFGLKVNTDGSDSSREIITRRVHYGRYEVTIPGRDLQGCAIVATPRRSPTPDDEYPNNLNVLISVSDPTQQRLDTVMVTTSRTRATGVNQIYADVFDDHPFNLVVSC
jgi:hypothetical protein